MRRPKRLRRRYVNTSYPLVLLRFEDGHEIEIPRGHGKTFDAYAGETIRIVVLWDESTPEPEREVLSVVKAEDLEEAE